ncbi:hypothetical protein [Candidatus Phyllobacterium onerii]|uniref:hypothetical protein n=1 Tax=Candidatus Phyllobacterium onerii TaxID=3020828 RepID=UPI00232B6CC0|nr:hypothetical protein [Phyllobacterium sp. IY22]
MSSTALAPFRILSATAEQALHKDAIDQRHEREELASTRKSLFNQELAEKPFV